MRELAILSCITLDGVMQGPTSSEEDVSGGFTSGGWGALCWDQAMPWVYAEAMDEPYNLLFGRKTYDTFAAHWPHIDDENDPVASRLNGAHKFVRRVRSCVCCLGLSPRAPAEMSQPRSSDSKPAMVRCFRCTAARR